MKLRYFKESEFAGCIPSCKLSQMNEAFMNKLDTARELAGVPFIVNSAYRSKEYELSKGRSGNSSHCKGLAIDLLCVSAYMRSKILSALFQVGFVRVGIYPQFIHVDLDDDKIQAVWLDDSSILRG